MTTTPDEVDLANWMGHLDPGLRSTCPLIRLAIPGSHDSMMYKMLRNSPVTPEAPEFLDWLVKFAPSSIKHWVVTQGADATRQLENGIRYFDIRACKQGEEFMLCHGVFSGESSQPLKDILRFLDAHRQEVVVLDFQHVYRCEAEDHRKYCDELIALFGQKIYPRKGNELAECTLQRMTEQGQQVIVVYRDYRDEKELFWTEEDLRTPWPNTTNINNLVAFIDERVKERTKSAGQVTQCVLTPDGRFIADNVFYDLKSSCALPVLQTLTEWIVTRKSGPNHWPGHNIFIADFVDLNEFQFVKAVLSLNGLQMRSFNAGAFNRRLRLAEEDEDNDQFLSEKKDNFCCGQ